MANLYDKIRKKKKENLENLYLNLQGNHPTSMAEAIAPPAKFTDLIGKSSGQYAGDNAEITNKKPSTPKEINEAVDDKNEGECINGVWVGGDNEGESCQQSDESDEKDALNEKVNSIAAGTRTDDEGELINPDADEDGGLFGRKKGGSLTGNLLRNASSILKGVVGKEGSAHIIDAAPFGDPAAKQGTFGEHVDQGAYDNVNKNLNVGGGNQSSQTFELADGSVYTGTATGGIEGSEGTPDKPYSKEWKGPITDEYPEGMPYDVWIKQPGNKEKEEEFVKGQKGTPGTPGTPGEVKSTLTAPTTETELGEMANNENWIKQAVYNWGQKTSQNFQENQENKDLKDVKSDMTKNEKDDYRAARKKLRKSGDLPGRSSKGIRKNAIMDAMDRQNRVDALNSSIEQYNAANPTAVLEGDALTTFKKDFATEYQKGIDDGEIKIYGKNESLSTIGRSIRTGKITYADWVEKNNPSKRDRDIVKNITSDANQPGHHQYSDDKKVDKPIDFTENLDPDFVKANPELKNMTKAQIDAALTEWNKTKKQANTPPPTSLQGDSSVYSKPAFKKQSGIFKMKRGRLLPPGK